MSNFKPFKQAVNAQLALMSQNELFYTDVTKDEIWDKYLGSFPEGTNPIFRERTHHDCNCCKQFIRAGGSIVSIQDGVLTSIWDITVDEPYQTVANALSNLVKSRAIENVYRHYEKNLGTDYNHEFADSSIKWEHFHFKLPAKFTITDGTIASYKGNTFTNKKVLQRSLEEITSDSIEVVLDLIAQNSLYRGEEHKAILLQLRETLNQYTTETVAGEEDHFLWFKSLELGMASKFRNTVIGTLLVDLSEGVALEVAVKKFEDKVAPENYKRTSALITPRMITMAEETVAELGIEPSLHRRFAVTEDLTINNVIYADRAAKKAMGIFGGLKAGVADKLPNFDKVEEVTIATFIADILPKATSIELMMSNTHMRNLVSLVAPIEATAKPIFKWGNNFSWSYNGNVTDSMKENVKRAGGKVDGKLRFSIQWNDNNDNPNDLDAHCKEPNGNHIFYSSKRSSTSGELDVDIMNPDNKVAVENITWKKVPNGDYRFYVHNYSHRGGTSGFTAEIEFMGKIYSYTYAKPLRREESVPVAVIRINGDSLTFIESLPSTTSSKEVWGINTEKFHKVDMVMNSPNHWDGEETGNKHWFFMLEGCINPDASRGFYNEFLSNELHDHRKVFEVLGSKLKTEKSDNQLSGLGFSSTQTNHVLCRVSGAFNRIIKIKF